MPNSTPLGRLHKITDLRKVWLSEPTGFTPWLAGEDNLSLLADTLGLELELVSQEQGVGPYRADIVCKNLDDESLVLIENQLEKTDHTHLGQLMTYAAGLDAVTTVWIAKRFTDEHRAALDWLNEITGPNTSFFGLEIELWRIGNSPMAPKFNIVSKPNEWVKTGGGGKGGGSGGASGLSPTKVLQQDFWRVFRQHLSDQDSALKPRKARAQHWLNMAIGRAGMHLGATVNTQSNQIGAELYLGGHDAKHHFGELHADRVEIEANLGFALEWCPLPEKAACRIRVDRPNTPITNRDHWPAAHAWLADKLEALNAEFRERVQELPADYDEDGHSMPIE